MSYRPKYITHTPGDIALCFDDILLVPAYSTIDSRKSPKIDISAFLGSPYKSLLRLEIPIIPSPMDTISSSQMLATMSKLGTIGIMNRQISENEKTELYWQLEQIRRAKQLGTSRFGCAISASTKIIETKIQQLIEIGCYVICVDVQHAFHAKIFKIIEQINNIRSKNNLGIHLMVGNICTRNAAIALAKVGVDSIKIGTGSGAVCTTRRVTGFGVPQLTAVNDCHNALCDAGLRHIVGLIGDGGIRNTGDMVKCLYAGADAIMGGYIFAGSSDTPTIDGKHIYRGMSSFEVSKRKDVCAEGVSRQIDSTKCTSELMHKYCMGIKAGFSMAGAENIDELRQCKYNIVTPLSIQETGTI